MFYQRHAKFYGGSTEKSHAKGLNLAGDCKSLWEGGRRIMFGRRDAGEVSHGVRRGVECGPSSPAPLRPHRPRLVESGAGVEVPVGEVSGQSCGQQLG